MGIGHWQEFLYPLGVLSSLFFTARVLYQWFVSEKLKKCASPRGFWILSLFGHAFHLIHSAIQMQLPIALVQGSNFVIAHRNLNLLKEKNLHYAFRKVIWHFFFMSLFILGLFFYCCVLSDKIEWMRSPAISYQIPLTIQYLGFIGIILSASRFWIQWIAIEKQGYSTFNKPFWVLSLTGAILSTIYFVVILDWINILGTAFTLIPYARNLFFLRKKVYE